MSHAYALCAFAAALCAFLAVTSLFGRHSYSTVPYAKHRPLLLLLLLLLHRLAHMP
jgi:hypothetical protein